MTGLEEAIKRYPVSLLTEHNGERFTDAEIEQPEKLRLIYDVFSSICSICSAPGIHKLKISGFSKDWYTV